MSSTAVAELKTTQGYFKDYLILDDAETTGAEVTLRGGRYSIRMSDITTETLQIQIKDTDGNWLSLDDGSFTVNDSNIFEFARGTVLRVTTTGATPKAWISTNVRE